jgi:hypothetical protein
MQPEPAEFTLQETGIDQEGNAVYCSYLRVCVAAVRACENAERWIGVA